MFTTERLRLREWRSTDTPNFMRIWNDVRCQPTLSNSYIVPKDTTQIEEQLIKPLFLDPKVLLPLAITLNNENQTFVGYITIRVDVPKHRDGTLGIAVLPEYWNKGYGTEALRFVIDHCFVECNLHRVSLGVIEGNEAAKKVYERL